MSDKKVVIRVINTQALRQSEKAKATPKEIVVYRWDRIFGALILVVVLLTGLLWGVSRLANRPAQTGPSAAKDAPRPVEMVSTGRIEGEPATSVRGENKQPGPENASGTSADSAPIAGISREKADEQTSPSPIPNAEQAPTGTLTPKSDARAAAQVALLSSHIKRARLTSKIVDGEPVDSVGPVIPMNEKGLVKVYLFQETSGLKGRILFHDWYWKGRRIAHARIPVKRDEHTAASSKFIDRIMMGPWEVRIVDEKDNVLARTSFEVR